MSNKVSYAKLNLKVNTDVNTFNFMDNKVEVLKYLPIEDKYDLIMIALQKSEEDGIYNELMLDMYFHLYMIYMYSNLSFTEKQKENEAKIYDNLKSNGFLDAFLAAMDEDEYNELYDMMISIKEEILKYRNTAGAVLQSLINDLPQNAQQAAAIVKNFDPDKYQEVINFAKAAGKPD